MQTETDGTEDVLVVTTLDGRAYATYDRAATALGARTPALVRHVLDGVAPTLAAATERITAASAAPGDGAGPTTHLPLQLAATLLCGDVIVGGEARCALTTRAVRAHEEAVATRAWTADLLARARQTYATAQTEIAAARAAR